MGFRQFEINTTLNPEVDHKKFNMKTTTISEYSNALHNNRVHKKIFKTKKLIFFLYFRFSSTRNSPVVNYFKDFLSANIRDDNNILKFIISLN